ncbi:GNAT family N-acetyltransferase [Streptomyces sp. H10-C2]|uniref:GNAT family N-acetyltransferase n=1 Tax=unclassified Streptomyces TaxID=2593676 RepID=UPI0024B8A0AA|nr:MULTISPECIES: GNAT family N-acetyltransferase [unclassified Streptomyces]MDJ0346701.1 GNAT family N-acetyltransferase [Streptomyces sp. PH10-H1]MDJ0374609.1 GNAT family N-acetyltransferase [Streptomyces sp. H10-C2]
MIKWTRKMKKHAVTKPPLAVNAARLREGWPAPAGGRIRLIRPGEAAAADALLNLAGVKLDPYVRKSLDAGSLAAALMTGLDDSRPAFYTATMRGCATPRLVDGLPCLALLLVAVDASGEVVGVLSGMPSLAVVKMALGCGFTTEQALAMSLAIAKVQGLAIAEHARGQGLAAELLERAWQVYRQLGYAVLYGSFEVGRDLERFYAQQGFTVLGLGGRLSLQPLNLPFLLHAGNTERMFSRWHLPN